LILDLVLASLGDEFDDLTNITVLILTHDKIQKCDFHNLILNLNMLESKLLIDITEIEKIIKLLNSSVFNLEINF
jgi:hypothetical protein